MPILPAGDYPAHLARSATEPHLHSSAHGAVAPAAWRVAADPARRESPSLGTAPPVPTWKRELIARRASKGVPARDGAADDSPCEPSVPEWKRELAARRKSVPAAAAAQSASVPTEFQFIAGAVFVLACVSAWVG